MSVIRPTCLAALLLASAPAAVAAAEMDLTIAVQHEVAPIEVAGTEHLVYELRLRNDGEVTVELLGLEVVAVGGERRWQLEDQQLARAVQIWGPADAPLALPPGTSATVTLWLDYPADQRPEALDHRVRVLAQAVPGGGMSLATWIEAGRARVVQTLGAPGAS